MLILDYSLKTAKERSDFVEAYVQTLEEEPNGRQLELMADYICFALDREENQRDINTPNRMVTVNKRETSYEGIASKLEGGEDAIYNLIRQDKNVILSPAMSITPEDIENVPFLKQVREAINCWERRLQNLSGRDRFIAKKATIQLRQDQYILKNSYYQPIYSTCAGKGSTVIDWTQDTGYWVNEDTYKHLTHNKIDLGDPKVVSGLLQNYSKLKDHTYDLLDSDLKWILMDLEKLIDESISGIYKDILELKIDGASNQEIQDALGQEAYTQEYISALWRNKIPAIIADKYKENRLNYIFTYKAKGEYKTCSRCGETKLAHNRYFSQNKGVRTRWYSICKVCRNKKIK